MNNPFSYKITKENKTIIYRNSQQIKIIKGIQNLEFIELLRSGNEERIQIKLAKLTGHYKHGNEKGLV